MVSCSHRNSLSNSRKVYSYTDTSGQYALNRTIRVKADELISRSTLLDSNGKELEIVTAVSTIKSGKLLPSKAWSKVYFDSMLYQSHLQVDIKKKGYTLNLRSPEKKWNGSSFYAVDKKGPICFYSQLAECLKQIGYLQKNDNAYMFSLVWDAYPYNLEQLEGFSDKDLLHSAGVRYDGEYEKYSRFEVVLSNGQALTYFFDDNLTMKKFFWVAQGISMVEK